MGLEKHYMMKQYEQLKVAESIAVEAGVLSWCEDHSQKTLFARISASADSEMVESLTDGRNNHIHYGIPSEAVTLAAAGMINRLVRMIRVADMPCT